MTEIQTFVAVYVIRKKEIKIDEVEIAYERKEQSILLTKEY